MSAVADPVAPASAIAGGVSVKSPPVAAAGAAKPKADSPKEAKQKLEKKLHPTDETEFTKLAKAYRESGAESLDLFRLYEEQKGDMSAIVAHLPFSSDEDRVRYRKLVDDAKLPVSFPWTNLEAPTVEDPSEDLSNEPVQPDRKRRKVGADGKVVIETMAEKEKQRIESLVSSLQKKYCKKKEDKYEEPSAADFEAAQKRVDARKQGLPVVNEEVAVADGDSRKRKAAELAPGAAMAPAVAAAAAAEAPIKP